MRQITAQTFFPLLAAALALGACSSDDSTSNPSDAGTGQKTDAGSTSNGDSSMPGTDAGGSTDAQGAGDTASATKDIVDTAVAAGQFKTLVAAVQAAGLEATLRGTGPFTVFAPPDAAFAKLPTFLAGELVTAPYKTELALILKYHVLAGDVKAADILGKMLTPATVEGGKLSVDGSNDKVVINGSINVTTPDVMASNGVIHVVDGVLLPSIVDTAVGYDDGTNKFSTLVTAVTAAGLADTLSKPGTLTVFAPTDKAFADLETALGDAAFNAILADKAKLTKILTYHVLATTVYSPQVQSGDVTTLETDKLTLTVANGKVSIKDSTTTAANVILTDLPNSNGAIHVIDKVLIPPGL